MASTIIFVLLIVRSASLSEVALLRSPPSVITIAYVRSRVTIDASASRSDVPPDVGDDR